MTATLCSWAGVLRGRELQASRTSELVPSQRNLVNRINVVFVVRQKIFMICNLKRDLAVPVTSSGKLLKNIATCSDGDKACETERI